MQNVLVYEKQRNLFATTTLQKEHDSQALPLSTIILP